MMTIQEAAQALRSNCCYNGQLFTGVSTDSRTVQPGDLFVALSGENFDGHEFVLRAAEKGAVAAIVKQQADNNTSVLPLPLIKVKDTLLALGQLAAYWRRKFTLPLIAVTGSNGKTTAKEMIAVILRKKVATTSPSDHFVERVLVTEGNLNNAIGVPQTLLRLRSQHVYAVIEMGMNHAGEINYLTRLAKPGTAVITNASAAHIAVLGSTKAIACAKGEIFAGLDQQGTAIINTDDEYADLWCLLAQNKRIISFGLAKNAQVSATYRSDLLANKITLKVPEGVAQVTLQVPGKHNVLNALAAAAVAVDLGIDKQIITLGLEAFSGVGGRMQKKNGLHHATIIDDSYNANPASVQAAIAVLAALPGKKIFVFGDMSELGKQAVDFHQHIGEQTQLAGIDQLFTFGELSAYASTKFGANAQHFQHIENLATAIKQQLGSDTTVLVKASRFMQMERLVKKIEAT